MPFQCKIQLVLMSVCIINNNNNYIISNIKISKPQQGLKINSNLNSNRYKFSCNNLVFNLKNLVIIILIIKTFKKQINNAYKNRKINWKQTILSSNNNNNSNNNKLLLKG